MEATYTTRITVLEQIGYREWTESLGFDREWTIQESQARLYEELQSVSAKAGGFALPLRYDYMILLTSNIAPEVHAELLEVARKHSRISVRLASSCGVSPLEAEVRALKLLSSTEPGGFTYESCRGVEIVVMAHLDVNNITGMTREVGVIRTYHSTINMVSRLSTVIEKNGGIIQYLGGDNMLVVLPTVNYVPLLESLVNKENLKAGVGAAKSAREALKLAARALHDIRSNRDMRVVFYIDI